MWAAHTSTPSASLFPAGPPSSLLPSPPVPCLQAMHKLGEPTALVKVRQADTMLAKEVLEPARKQYAGEQ